MFRLLLSTVVVLAATRVTTAAAPPVELELVTERGVQITAPQQWLQLLAGIGINHVRVRGGQGGEEPKVTNRGNAQRPDHHVIGVLTSRDQLRLPGGTFARTDREKLKDYFARLGADGADSIAAPRYRFGLTERELSSVLADLAQPIDFETKGLAPRAAIDRLQTKLSLKFAFDAEAERVLRSAAPIADEFKNVARGAGTAIILRSAGLAMRPEKLRGQPVAYRVVVATSDAIRRSPAGAMSAKDMQYWPIGWEPERAPGELTPSLFEALNAEIDGYTLEEALAAISPRLKMPMFLDRAALAAHRVDPAKIQVKLARTRTSYKRVIDRVLSQARLGSDIRVDEAGVPFLWITR